MRLRNWTLGLAGSLLAIFLTTGPAWGQERDADKSDRKSDARSTDKESDSQSTDRRSDAADRKSDSQDSRTRTGQVASVNEGKIKLSFPGNKEESYDVNDSAKVTIDGQKATIDDLKKGDRVRATLDKEDQIQSISAARFSRGDEGRGQEQRTAGREENANRPLLGALLAPSPTTGAQVRQVDPQGPAARAGLRAGDYILSVNDQKIAQPPDVDQALAGIEPGSEAKLSIWRNGAARQMTVSFAEQRQAGFRGNADDNRDRGSDSRRSDSNGQRSDSGDRRSDSNEKGEAWLGVIVADFAQQQQVPPPTEQPGQPQQPGQSGQQQGAFVQRVFPSGPAARAGMRPGDVILSIDGQKVARSRDVVNMIDEMEPAHEAEIVVSRSGQNQTLKATLADRSKFFGSESGGEQRGFRGNFGRGDEEEIPESAMMLEHDRRLAEQHQRLEERLDKVLEELRALRKELGSKSKSTDEK